MYIGTHACSIDRKGRVSLLAEFRHAVGDSSNLLLFKHPNSPTLFGGDAQAIIDRVSESGKDLAEKLAATGFLMKYDSDGRMIVPKVVRDELFQEAKHLLFTGHVWYFQVGLESHRESINKAASHAAELVLKS